MQNRLMKSIISIVLCCAITLTCLSGIFSILATSTTEEGLKAFNDYVANYGNNSSKSGLLSKFKEIDENAKINEIFIKHAVDGVKAIGTNRTNENSEMIAPGNDGYVAINATVDGKEISGVAYIPHTDEIIEGEVGYYSAASKGDFVVRNGIVTDYKGTAKILVFANETVTVDFSNATCKDTVEAVYFRTAYANSRILTIKAHSFENFQALKAVFFQEKVYFVYGNIETYAFANNANLKYVKLMDTLYQGGIQDYAFYNCPSLQLARGGYLRLANAQYGYGAFAKTGIRDYYLNNGMKYNNGANQGNVFGQEPACSGDVNILTFTQARTNITATNMATLAQEASDNYSGEWTSNKIKNALVASFSEFGTPEAVEFSDFEASADKANGNLTIKKDGITVNVDFYRNNKESIRDLTVKGYKLSPEYSSSVNDYEIHVPQNVVNINLYYKLNSGSKIESIIGNTNMIPGQNTQIVINSKDASDTSHTYTINVIRTSDGDDEENNFSLLDEYVDEVGNDFTKDGFLTRLKSVDSNATIDQYFIKHAVDGVSIKGNNRSDWDSEMIVPGNDGYISVVATVNGKRISGTAKIQKNDEEILDQVAYYTASSHPNFVVSNGIVTNYTGTAKILVFANETVTVDFSKATCKDQIEAIYFRTAYSNSRVLTIKDHSFENFTALKAVVFQEKQYYVCGNIGTYAFSNNANLKYVKLMDTLNSGGIQDYAFYNCPSLQLARGGYLRLANAQYGYGAFTKTGIRDYYLNNGMKYNTAANQGNVFGQEPACKGEVNVLTFAQARTNITATHMATLAAEKADNYSGVLTSSAVKSTLDSSYSEFGTATSSWTTAFKNESNKIFGVFTIVKDGYAANLDFYRNDNEAINSLTISGYQLDKKFDSNIYDYEIKAPENIQGFSVKYKLTFGAKLIEVKGNTNVPIDQDGEIILEFIDASSNRHIYKVKITRVEINFNTKSTEFELLNKYVGEVGNDFTESGFFVKLNSLYPNSTIDECFIKHAVDGVSVIGENESKWDNEMIAPGNDGYVAVIATVNGKKMSGVARIPHDEETIIEKVAYYSDATHNDFSVDDGVVTDYTGDAKILVFANETVTVDFSNATCKDKIKAIYFRTSYSSSRILTIKAHSFENFDALKAVFFQEKIYSVYGNIETYAFANNKNLRYVKLMDTLYNGGIQDYAFYNCPSLQLARGGYLRLPAAQYGYGAFSKTGIRDYYLNGTTRYNGGAGEGNVFGYEATCSGKINIISFYNARNNITLTHMATLAQNAADTYDGANSETDIMNVVKESYSSFGTSNIEWTKDLEIVGNASFGVLSIVKDDNNIPIRYYRNDDQALINLSVKGYNLSTEFVQKTFEYSIDVPNSITDIEIVPELVYGAKVVSISGNKDMTPSVNTTIKIKLKSKSGKDLEYTINVIRIDDLDLASLADLIEKGINSATIKNGCTSSEIKSIADLSVLGWNCQIKIKDFYIQNAIEGATENGTEIIVPGTKGYVASLLTIKSFGQEKTISILKDVTPSYEDFSFASESKASDFDISEDGKTLNMYSGNAEKVVIPEGVEKLGDLWFYGEPYEVKALILPSTLTKIPSDLCYGMKNLEVVSMGDNVTSAGGSTFAGCVSLRHVKLSRSLHSISYAMFRDTLSLSQLYIPNSVQSIEVSAFEYSLVRDLVIPYSVKKIGNYAFSWGVTNANIFYQRSDKGVQITQEQAGIIQRDAVNKVREQRRVITLLNPEVELGTGGVFSTDFNTSWCWFNIRLPKGSKSISYIEKNYESFINHKYRPITYEYSDMSVCEAAVKAQILADNAYITENDNSTTVTNMLKNAYYCGNVKSESLSNYSVSARKAIGDFTINSFDGETFTIKLNVSLSPIYVEDVEEVEQGIDFGRLLEFEDFDADDSYYLYENLDEDPIEKDIEITTRYKKMSRRKKPMVECNIFEVFDGNVWTGILIYGGSVLLLAGITIGTIIIVKHKKKKGLRNSFDDFAK